MIVTVSSRHMEVSPALKAYAEKKVSRLTKYYDRIQEIEVVFDAGKGLMTVEMIVNAEHNKMFVAREESSDAYAGVDACLDKVERQITEHKDRHRNRKHKTGEDKRLLA